MKIKGKKVTGKFIKRLNRFLALVEINGNNQLAHIPNSGRMKELLIAERKVILRKVDNSKRKSRYDLIMVKNRDELVSIDSRLPTQIFMEGFAYGKFEEYTDYHDAATEINLGKSRIDVCLSNHKETCYLELKSVTLVENEVAMFPDAPTKRGVKHIEELINAKKKGYEAGIMFIILRNDAALFSPNYKTDPDFSKALVKAYNKGIKISAYTCKITKEDVNINKRIPINLTNES